jgi:hypothetical protein
LDFAHILDPVILAAVQDVNVLRDNWDWIFGLAGVIGGLGAIVALLAQVVIAGHAFVQNLRRGHYELGNDACPTLRVAAAFTELAQAI